MSEQNPPRKRWRTALIVVAAIAALMAGVFFALQAAFPPARLATLLGEQVRQATGREIRINGELSIRLLPNLAVVANEVSLSNAAWGSQVDMARVQRVAFEVALRPLLDGQIRILSVAVAGADVLLESDGTGRANWAFTTRSDNQNKPPASVPAIDLAQLSLTDTRLSYRDGAKGTIQQLTIENLKLRMQGEQAALSAKLEIARQDWQIVGQIGRPSSLFNRAADWPFDLKLSAAGSRVSLAGTLASDTLSAEVNAELTTPAALLPWFSWAKDLPMPITLNTRLTRTADAIQANPMRLSLAGQEIRGQLSLHTTDAGPSLKGKLLSPRLELQKLLPANAQRAGSSKETPLGDTLLPFDLLPEIPVNISLQIEQLQLPGMPLLSAVNGQLEASHEKLSLAPLSIMLDGGQVQGEILLTKATSTAAQTHLSLAAKALPVTALGGGRQFRGGLADFRINLAMSGNTPRKLVASANGEVLLSLRKLMLAGKAAELERDPLTALIDALSPEQSVQQGLTMECAVIRLPLVRGVAKIERSIAMETDQIAVAASGVVDLGRQNLSLVFQPHVKKGLGINQSNLANLVMLKGPLDHPSIGLDPRGIAGEAATLGIAVATGGLSLLADRVINKLDDGELCRLAASGRPVRTEAPKASRRGLPDLPNLFERKR